MTIGVLEVAEGPGDHGGHDQDDDDAAAELVEEELPARAPGGSARRLRP